MDFEKCPRCENHALQEAEHVKIIGEFLGADIVKGTEHIIMCAKCEYESDKIFTPIIKSWWKLLIGK